MKFVHFILALSVFYSASALPSPCTSHVKFAISVISAHKAGQLSRADVDAIAGLPVVESQKADPELAGQHRLGRGVFHIAYHLNNVGSNSVLSSYAGDVFRKLNDSYFTLATQDRRYQEIYLRSVALGVANANLANSIRQGSAVATTGLVIDSEGNLVGNIVKYIDPNVAKQLDSIFFQLKPGDRARAVASMLPTLNKLWNANLPKSPSPFDKGAHGDLHRGNIYLGFNGQQITWTMADMGPIPYENAFNASGIPQDPNNADEMYLVANPAHDRDRFYEFVTTEQMHWQTRIDKKLIFEEGETFPAWANSMPATALYAYRTYQAERENLPNIIYLNSVFHLEDGSRERFAAKVIRAVTAAKTAIPANKPVAQQVLQEILDDLAADPKSDRFVGALSRLGECAYLNDGQIVFYTFPH